MCLQPRLACPSKPYCGQVDTCLPILYLHRKHQTQRPFSQDSTFLDPPSCIPNWLLIRANQPFEFVFGRLVLMLYPRPHQFMAQLMLRVALKPHLAKFCPQQRALNNFLVPTLGISSQVGVLIIEFFNTLFNLNTQCPISLLYFIASICIIFEIEHQFGLKCKSLHQCAAYHALIFWVYLELQISNCDI